MSLATFSDKQNCDYLALFAVRVSNLLALSLLQFTLTNFKLCNSFKWVQVYWLVGLPLFVMYVYNFPLWRWFYHFRLYKLRSWTDLSNLKVFDVLIKFSRESYQCFSFPKVLKLALCKLAIQMTTRPPIQ